MVPDLETLARIRRNVERGYITNPDILMLLAIIDMQSKEIEARDKRIAALKTRLEK